MIINDIVDLAEFDNMIVNDIVDLTELSVPKEAPF